MVSCGSVFQFPAMSSEAATKDMQVDKKDEPKPEEAQKAQIGVLEEDDEFEEFPVQGKPL